eukprot:242991_1
MTGIMENGQNGLQTSVKTASRFVVRFATLLTYCSLFAIFFGSSGVLCATKKNTAKKSLADRLRNMRKPKQSEIDELTELNKKHSDVIAGKNDTIKTLKEHHAKLYNWN